MATSVVVVVVIVVVWDAADDLVNSKRAKDLAVAARITRSVVVDAVVAEKPAVEVIAPIYRVGHNLLPGGLYDMCNRYCVMRYTIRKLKENGIY